MYKKIYEKFRIVGLEHFYGDFFDSRGFISSILSKMETKNILDVGCGAGVLLSCMSAQFKVGLDMNFEALKQMKKLDKDIQPVFGDAQHLPFRDNVFETITAMHLFPVIDILGGDWIKAIKEANRVAMKQNLLLITGANRTSRHFEKTHSLEHRKKYLNYKQQNIILEKYYDIILEGFGPHPKWLMYPLKIIYRIPEKLTEFIGIEKFIFKFLKSKRYLKEGRSYVMICKSKEKQRL